MALPVTITNLATTLAPVGPFKVAAGTAYWAARETTGAAITNSTGSNATEMLMAQTFTATSSHSMSRATIQFRATGGSIDFTVGGSVRAYAELRVTNPTGTVLATSSDVVKSFVNGITAPMVFNFPTQPLLTNASVYCLVIYLTGGAPGFLTFTVWGNATNTYAGGTLYPLIGGTDPATLVTAAVAPFDIALTIDEALTTASDAYYFFGRDSTTGSTLRVYKSPVTTTFSIVSSGTTSNGFGLGASSAYRAQSFTAPAGATSVSSVSLTLAKNNSPTDNIIVDIFATDGAGKPVGSSLGTSNSVVGSGLTTSISGASVLFSFATPVPVTATTQYAVAVSRTGVFDVTNNYVWPSAATEVNAAEKSSIYNSSTTTWGSVLTVDLPLVVTLITGGPDTSWSSTPYVSYLTTSTDDVLAAYQVGATIHFAQLVGGRAAAGVRYFSYDASTDTISGQETVAASTTVTGQATAGWGCSLVVRANGNVVVFYNGVQTKTSGTFRARVYYRERTGVNTWGTETQVDPVSANDNVLPIAILGAANRVHFVWGTAAAVSNRTLSAANAMNSAIGSGSMVSPGDGVSYDRSGTTKVVFISNATGQTVGRFDSSDNPTATFTTPASAVNATVPHRIGVDISTDDVTIIYRNSADSDLYAIKSTDDGATFGTATSFFVGTVASADTNASRSSSGSQYQRGSQIVVGYVVNDNSTWKYNEYLVRYVSYTNAWNSNDRSANITLSNTDKTATVATAANAGVHSTTARIFGNAGKYYAEFLINAIPSANINLGFQLTTADETSSLSGANITSNGKIWDGVTQRGDLGSSLAANDVVCLAIDNLAKVFWFRKNGGLWNNDAAANPATGTNGLSCGYTTVSVSLWFASSAINVSTTIRTEIADLTLQGPAGFSSWMDEVIPQPSIADAWNANDKNGGTLSNSDKTITNGQVRSTKIIAANDGDKYYCEVVWGNTAPADGGSRIGIHDSTYPINQNLFPISAHSSFSLGVNGIYLNQSTITNAVNLSVNCIGSFAFDTVNLRGWVRKDNGLWNNNASADPATNVGGMDLSAWAGKTFAVGTTAQYASSDTATVRTTKDLFTQTTPIGFKSWMGETLVVPDLGVLASGAAALSGTGIAASTGTGTLTAQSAVLVSNALSGSIGTATLSAVAAASSNYASWSQDLDNAAWTKQNVTIGANAAAAPDGSTTAESVTSTALNGPHLVAGAAIATPSGTVTSSIYAKAGTGQWIQLYDPSNKFANFDLINGVTGNDTGDVTARITAVGNGWYRCSITFDKTLVYNCRAYACILNTNSPSANPSHTSVLSIYLWGAQLEMTAQPTAYLPTQGTVPLSLSTTLIGSGITRWNATGALIADVATTSGTGTVVSPPATGTGALVATSLSITNLARYSQELDNVAWGGAGSTATANVIAAPDATITAELITDNVGTGNHFRSIGGFGATASSLTLTHSVYAKAGTFSWLQIFLQPTGRWANFNLATGTVGSVSSGTTAQIISVGDGWYRCSINNSTGNNILYLLLATGDVAGPSSYTAAGTGNLYLWGVQTEEGAAPTEYIPTGATAVSRSISAIAGVSTGSSTGSGSTISAASTVTGTGISGSIGSAADGAASDLVISDPANSALQVFGGTGGGFFENVGQTFIAGGPSISRVRIALVKSAVGAPAGTIQVKLHTVTAGHMPLTEIGASSVVTCSSISTLLSLVEFIFSPPVSVTPGTEYVFTTTRSVFEDYPNDINLNLIFSNPYANGQILHTASAVWEEVGPYDLDCVISFVAIGGLLSSSSTLAGSGTVASPAITGTGTLSAQSSSETGTGISASIGSGAGGVGDVVIAGSFVGNLAVGSTGNPKVAQGFIAAGTSITKVQFKGLYVSGTLPTDEVQVKIFTVDASHNPLTQVGVTSNLVSASSLNTTPSVVDFTFASAVPVSDGVEYVFVLERTGAPNSTSPYYINLVSSSYGGATLCYRQYNGTTWSAAFGGAYDIDCVVSHGAVVGGLLAASSTIVGTGAGVVSEATGTGTLSAQSSTLSGAGISESRSTSTVLNSQNSTLVGAGLSTSLSTVAALVAPNRTMAGLGISQSIQTLAALTAQAHTLSSVAVSQSVQTLAALTAQAHTLSAVGVSESRSTSTVLNSQNSTLAGLAISGVTGTGTLVAQSSTKAGTGIGVSTGTGGLIAGISTLSGSVGTLRAVISWVRLTATQVTITVSSGPLAVVEAADTPSFVGTVVNRGTLAVVEAADTPSFVGTVVNQGTLTVVETTDTANFVGTVIGAGTGVLTSTSSTVVSSGKSISTGTGVLTSSNSTVASSGLSSSTGTGVLTSTSTIVSSGKVAWAGTGVLTSTNCVSVGLGVSASIGTGVLNSTTSTIVSSGTVAWRGTGVLISTNSTIVSLGVATSFATLAVTEAPDITIFVASGISSGLLTVVEPPDIAVFAGTSSSTGTGVLTSTSTVVGSGKSISTSTTGVLNSTTSTLAGSGSVFHKATLVATEASDTAVFAGTVVNRGTLTVVEANDNALLVGTVVNNGILVATEVSDTAVIVGTVVNRGTLVAIEGADIAIFVTAGISSGVLTVVEATDTANFNGTVVNRGTLTVVEANDNALIVGTIVNNGALVALEAPDAAAFAGTVLRRVSAAAALFIAA